MCAFLRPLAICVNVTHLPSITPIFWVFNCVQVWIAWLERDQERGRHLTQELSFKGSCLLQMQNL